MFLSFLFYHRSIKIELLIVWSDIKYCLIDVIGNGYCYTGIGNLQHTVDNSLSECIHFTYFGFDDEYQHVQSY